MAEITEEFNSWLSDKTKTDWIEIKVVRRLHQLDTQKIFIAVFHEALQKCNNIRTPSPDKHGKLVYEAANHKIPLGQFKDSNFDEQSGLGGVIGSTIALELIQNLYDLNNQASSLRLIQELNSMSIDDDYKKYGRLFELINQNFFHSRSLLAVSMAPQIIEQYALTLGSTHPFKIISFQSFGEGKEKKELCTFILDGNQYICEFSKKKEGKFFGSVVQIRASDGSKSRTYYLKAHQWYPALNSKDSKDTYEHTFKYSSTVRSSCEIPFNLLRIDLREPFMYKVLEYLGYGPKTYIMVSPFILSGVFIVTEDLNSEPNKFYNIKQLIPKINLQDILDGDFEYLEPAKNILTIDFTEISILSSVLGLRDLHLENWGYVATEATYNQLKEGMETSPHPQIHIIDFLLMNDPIPLEEQFLSGHIPDMSIQLIDVSETFIRRLARLSKLTPKTQKEVKEIFDRRINQGIQANQQLLIHLSGRSIHDILEQTKQELLKQLDHYPLILKVIDLNEIPNQKNSLNELMKYCSDIETNNEIWNTFITEGYQQWYNNKLKKDQTPQHDQSEKTPKGE